jgi:hypothetical protein
MLDSIIFYALSFQLFFDTLVSLVVSEELNNSSEDFDKASFIKSAFIKGAIPFVGYFYIIATIIYALLAFRSPIKTME